MQRKKSFTSKRNTKKTEIMGVTIIIMLFIYVIAHRVTVIQYLLLTRISRYISTAHPFAILSQEAFLYYLGLFWAPEKGRLCAWALSICIHIACWLSRKGGAQTLPSDRPALAHTQTNYLVRTLAPSHSRCSPRWTGGALYCSSLSVLS